MIDLFNNHLIKWIIDHCFEFGTGKGIVSSFPNLLLVFLNLIVVWCDASFAGLLVVRVLQLRGRVE